MLRIVGIYAGILVAIFMVLSFFDSNGDYVIERQLWHLNKQYAEIIRDPAASPDKTYNDLVVAYESVIKQYPKSKLTPGIYLLIGQLYSVKKDLDKARDQFSVIEKLYPDDREIGAEALANIGKTYEIENKWSKAEEIYRRIIERYPLTNVGLSTPVYIAGYYQAKNDHVMALKAYATAVNFYKEVIAQNANTAVEFNALRLLAGCYFNLERWEEGMDALGDVLVKYAKSNLLPVSQAELIEETIHHVAMKKFGGHGGIKEIYRDFLEENPAHPLAKKIRQRIQELQSP